VADAIDRIAVGVAATRLVQAHHPDGVNSDDYETCDCGWTASDENERWADHLVHVLAVDGLLAEFGQRAELTRLQRLVERLPYRQRDYLRARLELRKLNDAMARKNRIIAKRSEERDLAVWLHAEALWRTAGYVIDKTRLQARIDAALAKLQQSLKPSAVVCDEAIATLQGDRSASASRYDEILGVCSDALERGWTVEHLAERIRAVYDPTLAAELERRARAAEAAGFDEPAATPLAPPDRYRGEAEYLLEGDDEIFTEATGD
jgi:hypothetical protein